MAALTVLFAVVTLLVGGQALFLDVLRLALAVTLVAATVGIATNFADGRIARPGRPVLGSPAPMGRGLWRTGA
jgi:hypothetical protein